MTTNSNQGATLINIESLINSHDQKLAILEKESKTQKQMLNNLLENDDEYNKASEEAAKLVKVKMLAKQKVLKTSNAQSIVEKVKDAQVQIKELKVALSDYLSQYVNLSGTNQIEGADGVVRQIVYSAKLIKKLE